MTMNDNDNDNILFASIMLHNSWVDMFCCIKNQDGYWPRKIKGHPDLSERPYTSEKGG